jgi:threonine/homoserine/homoserine lactone efflux protein
MADLHVLALFAGAALALLLMPGPAVLYIIARSVDQGRLAGVVSALGLEIGTLVHVGAATLGLSALLASSALAFTVVKLLGAVYLIYLGVRRLLEKDSDLPAAEAPVERQPLGAIFRQGVVVNLLNPKLALFFLAFLPQFVAPAGWPVWRQILVLGLLFGGMALVTDSAYALLAGTVGGWLKQSRAVQSGQKYVTGGIYLALGLVAAVSGGHSSQ